MPPKAIVVFAEGFEEIEALTLVDVLRRAEVETELVGLDSNEVTGAHGVTVKMDRLLGEKEEADAIVLPGGMPGAKNLGNSEKLGGVLRSHSEAGKLVAGIGAAPACALAAHGLLEGKRATCYPGFEGRFGANTTHVVEDVVKDGNIFTSRGPGTALRFAVEIVREIVGDEAANALAKGTLLEK